ncbi:hypothetical protein ACW5W8_05085 [Aeromonas aquatilis]
MNEIIKCLKTIIFRFDMYKMDDNKNHQFVIRKHCERIGELIKENNLQEADVWDYITNTYGSTVTFEFQICDILRF